MVAVGENLDLNGVMDTAEGESARKMVQRNFSLPVDLTGPVDEMVGLVSPRDKWVVYTTAVLLLMEKSPEELREIFARVYGARQTGNLAPLIEAAKEKRDQADGEEAEESARVPRPAPRLTHIKGGKVTPPKS